MRERRYMAVRTAWRAPSIPWWTTTEQVRARPPSKEEPLNHGLFHSCTAASFLCRPKDITLLRHPQAVSFLLDLPHFSCIPPAWSTLPLHAGIPLLEIVSEPDMRTGKDVYAYASELRRIVRFLGISDGNMAEGSMRCDVNISVRPP